jgi:hypothetical protein
VSSIIPSPPGPASSTRRGLVDLAAQTFAGAKTFLATIVASAGIQVASLFNTNGTGASDVCVKVGTTVADASVNAAAKLLSIRTGIGATEVERYFATKDTVFLGGGGIWSVLIGSEVFFRTSGTPTFALLPSGLARSGYGIDINPAFGGFLSWQAASSGLMNQRGTDSSGTPGAAAIDRPVGKSAIAAAASSVVITNNLVTAASIIDITPMENATSNADFRQFKVTPAAGSFTVAVNTATATAWPFAFRVATMLA